MNIRVKAVAAALVGAAMLWSGGPGVSVAQEQKRVDAKKDWSIFQAGTGAQRLCWIVSQPTKSAAFRNGKAVEVRRGDIFMMIAIRPGDNVTNEVSFLGGYPFKKGSEVKASVGSDNFTLFTEGETAWAPSSQEDNAMVAAFRKGSNAKLEGTSTRGTKTVDTFSLAGFTAALDTAADLCK